MAKFSVFYHAHVCDPSLGPDFAVDVENVRFVGVALYLCVVPGKDDNFISPLRHRVAVATTGLVPVHLYEGPFVGRPAETPHFLVGTVLVVSTAPKINGIFETHNRMAVPSIKYLTSFFS